MASNPDHEFSFEFMNKLFNEIHTWDVFGRFDELLVINETDGVNVTAKHKAALYSQSVADLQLENTIVPSYWYFNKQNFQILFYVGMAVFEFVPGAEPLAKAIQWAPYVSKLIFAGKAVDAVQSQYSYAASLAELKKDEQARDDKVVLAHIKKNKQCAKNLHDLGLMLKTYAQQLQTCQQHANVDKCESWKKKAQQCNRPPVVEANNSKPVLVVAQYIDGQSVGQKEHCYCPGNTFIEDGCLDYYDRKMESLKGSSVKKMYKELEAKKKEHKTEVERLEKEMERLKTLHKDKLTEQAAQECASEAANSRFWFSCFGICFCCLLCSLAAHFRSGGRHRNKKGKKDGGQPVQPAQQRAAAPVDAAPVDAKETETDKQLQKLQHSLIVQFCLLIYYMPDEACTAQSMNKVIAMFWEREDHKPPVDASHERRFKMLQSAMSVVDKKCAELLNKPDLNGLFTNKQKQ